ncbi:hypothetical protein C2G38_2107206, partial [Gigaspora rosea]
MLNTSVNLFLINFSILNFKWLIIYNKTCLLNFNFIIFMKNVFFTNFNLIKYTFGHCQHITSLSRITEI